MKSNPEPWSYDTHKERLWGKSKNRKLGKVPRRNLAFMDISLGILKVSSLSVQTKSVSQWSVGTPAKVKLGGSGLGHFNFEEASRTVFDLRTEGAVYP